MQITLAMYADGAAPTLCKIAKFQPLEIAAETVLISHSITMRCDLTHIQSTIQTTIIIKGLSFFVCLLCDSLATYSKTNFLFISEWCITV